MSRELKRLYMGIRKVNPHIKAVRAIEQARAWIYEGNKVKFYMD